MLHIMKKRYYYIIYSLLLCIINEGYSQGLHFYGNEKRIAERSSFCVFTDEHLPAVHEKFTISFEYAAQNIESPGYIFYLKDTNGNEAFNLTYVYDNSQGSFMFAQDGKQIYYTAEYPGDRLHGKWMPISLVMDVANRQAILHIGHHQATIENIGPDSPGFAPQLFFGMCNHILETASFSIRNLTISNEADTWHFPLNESKGEEVHDSRGKVIGHVTNPVWLINRSYYWRELLVSHSSTPSGFVFAPQKQEFYIYNRDSILTYDIHRQTAGKHPYATQSGPFPIRLGMNFYDEERETVYPYELNWEKTFIAEMNPETKTWKTINQGDILLQMHHHSGVFNPQKHRFLFFGGYGNRKYYNTFLTYDLLKDRWDTLTLDGDPVSPRFFAGMALTPDGKQAYLYGGKGNEAGDQNVGIQYYYDFYRIDFQNGQIKKLWQHQAPTTNRIPTRDMILSKDGKHIYLLAYPEYKPETYLQLYRLSISDGSYEALGDSIPLTSEEIATNANLYFNRELEELYCVIQEFEKYGQSATRIYSLSDPPVSLAAVRFYDETVSSADKRAVWPYVLIVSLIVATGITFMIVERKRPAKRKPAADARRDISASHAGQTETHVGQTEEHIGQTETPVPEEPENEEVQEVLLPDTLTARKNSISLFGTFTATDRNGRDMTYMFSPKIRHLFIYILINSITKEGVLSSDLNSLFWPDKPDDKIKNLKNVTMNHLRKTLQEMEGIELTHQKGYFKLVLTDDCYCDYQRFVSLTGGLKHAPATREESQELYALLSQGKFLGSIEESLFDYPKQQAEAFTVSLLSEQIHTFYKNGKHAATSRICNILFAIDPLSDLAMTYAIGTYRRQNRSDKAIQLYSAFTKEYRRVMGEDYPIAFDDVNTDNIRL